MQHATGGGDRQQRGRFAGGPVGGGAQVLGEAQQPLLTRGERSQPGVAAEAAVAIGRHHAGRQRVAGVVMHPHRRQRMGLALRQQADPLRPDAAIQDRHRRSLAGGEAERLRQREHRLLGALADLGRLGRGRHWLRSGGRGHLLHPPAQGGHGHRRGGGGRHGTGGKRSGAGHARVHTGQDAAHHLDRHQRADHMGLAVDVLAERDRVAGLQGHRNVRPVRRGRVLQHRPTLQAGIRVRAAPIRDGWQHQAVGGLPQRRLQHHADAHSTWPVPAGAQQQVPPPAAGIAAGLGQQRPERGVDAGPQRRIGDLDGVGVLQHELAQAIGRQHGHPRARHHRRVAARASHGARHRLGIPLGPQDASGHLAAGQGTAMHLDLNALQPIHVGQRAAHGIGAERQRRERGGGALLAGQHQAASAALRAQHHQRVERVADLVQPQVESESGVAVDLGAVFEVAHAAQRQRDPAQGEVGGMGRGRQRQRRAKARRRVSPPAAHVLLHRRLPV